MEKRIWNPQLRRRLLMALPVLSLVIVLGVFWWLKLTGVTLAGEAFCGKQEHIHQEACGLTLSCTQTQDVLHTHGEACRETVLTCALEEEHTHEEGCYTTNLICTQAETAPHTHGDSCYSAANCTLESHTHDVTCYSNLEADVETAAQWEATLGEISPQLPPANRLVAVAKSQLDYGESQRNFVLDDAGVRRGYTRYGQWYGNPYGQWSATFVSFCVHYAQVGQVPVSAGAETLRLQWQQAGLYEEARTVQIGDVVFLDTNENASADTCAIVTEISGQTLTLIQGDLEDRVAQTQIAADSPQILGYGIPATGEEMQPYSTVLTDAPTGDSTVIAQKISYDPALLTGSNRFLLYRCTEGAYYALNGSGGMTPVTVDSQGKVSSQEENADMLLWTITPGGMEGTYDICNVATGLYLLSGTQEQASGVLMPSGEGVQILSPMSTMALSNESSQDDYIMALATNCYVWFDGTNGGLMSLSGSPNTCYTVESGESILLPSTWQTPAKYSYQLRGWYDVKNAKYYAPGTAITVTDNLVFYADWTATSYDAGASNEFVADTVGTDDYITTQVFDYSALFNVMSEKATVSISSTSHSETWSLVTSGTVPYGNESLGFIFLDWDGGGDISYPNSRDSANNNGSIFSGIANQNLLEALFATNNSFDPATGTGVIGKQYLGQGAQLFQMVHDPDSELNGYHYYDSKLNAASYNQSQQRFYVYEYLERTADSEKDGGAGAYSDFLPFNSPYLDYNGNAATNYTYSGENGEYAGVTHYQYDAKYNSNNNSTANAGTNYWFGMSVEVDFYLPDTPGTVVSDGGYGNSDLYGRDMHFKFSGDDDVWVYLDGKLVLDIGGIHGIESGDINFSSGQIMVNGELAGTLSGVEAGEHVLMVYYLERGSSQSNCAIYFNLSPRFHMSLEKEDVLNQHILNGAEFSVFMDKECTQPAQLWSSEEAYNQGVAASNVFRVENGTAGIWGFAAGKTYYLKETRAPDAAGYSMASGLIAMEIDRQGLSTFHVEVLENQEEAVSPGFTVYGFRIDEETQQVFLVVTNAADWVQEVTSIRAVKTWSDSLDHSGDSVTVYLTVTDPDGTVRRIREETLSADNAWSHTWENLPKFWEDGVTPVTYGIQEAYFPGYYPTVEPVTQITTTTTAWEAQSTFQNGKTHLLKTSSGCLAATSASADTLEWVTEEEAKSSVLAQWTATVSDSTVKLTNGAGQILTFNNSGSRYYYVTTSSVNYQTLSLNTNTSGIALYYTRSNRSYYMGSLNSSSRGSATTSSSSALRFTPVTQVVQSATEAVTGPTFQVTNTPLTEVTSVQVTKKWDVPADSQVQYEDLQITVKLLADGVDTGRTLTLSLKNSWTDTFQGLPYQDAQGNVITYAVEETNLPSGWEVSYAMRTVSGTVPTYGATVTNTPVKQAGPELPATGSAARAALTLGGGITAIMALVALWCLEKKKRKVLP